jgi:hypothetical protein
MLNLSCGEDVLAFKLMYLARLPKSCHLLACLPGAELRLFYFEMVKITGLV